MAAHAHAPPPVVVAPCRCVLAIAPPYPELDTEECSAALPSPHAMPQVKWLEKNDQDVVERTEDDVLLQDEGWTMLAYELVEGAEATQLAEAAREAEAGAAARRDAARARKQARTEEIAARNQAYRDSLKGGGAAPKLPQLPHADYPGWRQAVDAATKRVYYISPDRKSTWDHPGSRPSPSKGKLTVEVASATAGVSPQIKAATQPAEAAKPTAEAATAVAAVGATAVASVEATIVDELSLGRMQTLQAAAHATHVPLEPDTMAQVRPRSAPTAVQSQAARGRLARTRVRVGALGIAVCEAVTPCSAIAVAAYPSPTHMAHAPADVDVDSAHVVVWFRLAVDRGAADSLLPLRWQGEAGDEPGGGGRGSDADGGAERAHARRRQAPDSGDDGTGLSGRRQCGRHRLDRAQHAWIMDAHRCQLLASGSSSSGDSAVVALAMLALCARARDPV